jgi:hypothetical protein
MHNRVKNSKNSKDSSYNGAHLNQKMEKVWIFFDNMHHDWANIIFKQDRGALVRKEFDILACVLNNFTVLLFWLRKPCWNEI